MLRSVVAGVVIVIASLFGNGYAVELDDFIAHIQNASAQVQSYQSDFLQEKHLKMFQRPVRFSGRLSIVRPDKLRWEFFSPAVSAIIFDGDTGLRCNEAAPAVSFSLKDDPMMGMVAQQLWLWLGGDYAALGDLYDVAMEGEDGIVVTPKSGGMIRSVSLHFDGQGQPREVTIREDGGDFTRITFSNEKVDTVLPSTLFSRCDG